MHNVIHKIYSVVSLSYEATKNVEMLMNKIILISTHFLPFSSL